MIKVRYNRCEYNSYVYFKQNNNLTNLLLYVDDMLITARNKTYIQKLKAQLKKKFNIRDLREAKKILDMEITQDRDSNRLWLSHKNYVLKVLEKFNIAEVKPVNTPLAGHFELSSKQFTQSLEKEEKMSRVPHASAAGSLTYAMVCTRLDLACAVNTVSRFMSNSRKQH